MAKTAYINARVETKLKKEAEAVLERVGINTSDLVTMVLKQVVIQQGIPFDVCDRSHVPNAETRRAIASLERGGGKHFETTEELFADALGKNWRKKLR